MSIVMYSEYPPTSERCKYFGRLFDEPDDSCWNCYRYEINKTDPENDEYICPYKVNC